MEPVPSTRLGVAPAVDDKLYSEKVHELEESSPRGYVEDTAHKHGVKPELKMWAKVWKGYAAGYCCEKVPGTPCGVERDDWSNCT